MEDGEPSQGRDSSNSKRKSSKPGLSRQTDVESKRVIRIRIMESHEIVVDPWVDLSKERFTYI